MKIGLVIYGSLDTVSGGYLYDRKLASSLREHGDEVRLFSLPWRNYAAHLTDNLRFRLPPNLDLLIQDELNHPSLLVANARPHPYPVISLVHHLRSYEEHPAWLNTFYRFIERHYLRSVDGFIFNSKTTRDVVHAVAGGDKPNIIAYPPTDRFGTALPETLVARRAEQSTPLRLLFLGNVIPRKGLQPLLTAISRSSSVFRLDVVGSLTANPVYAREMQNLARDLPSEVGFHGVLDNDLLLEKLKQAHVLVVPSSYEGYGIVYLEGMAFGLPAIGTTGGAASEIITDGETGYLVPPGDAVILADRLATLAADRGLLRRMSLNALKRYHQQPTWEQTAKNIREFLLRMVS
jgi:glycosyltransferase involved in cell wall biosynthesis